MVVPEDIVDAAQNGDVATVRNWLDSNDVNDTDSDGCGLLTSACAGYQNGFEVLRLFAARANAKMRPIVWLMSPNVPNEIAWRVLEFWNPRSDGTKYHIKY